MRLVLAALAVVMLTPATAAASVSFTVNDTGDGRDAAVGDGSCDIDPGPSTSCTLRAAVQEANDTPDGDEIVVPAGNYGLTAQHGGVIPIDEDVTINGDSARTTVIAQEQDPLTGFGFDRIFDITGFAQVEINRVTLTGGRATNAAGFFGGNIRNTGGGVIISHSTITQGSGSSAGGIANVGGSVTLVDSTVTGNSATTGGGDAGAILNFGDVSTPAFLTIVNSTITGNLARLGGGIFSYNNTLNNVQVFNSTIAGNESTDRGGGGGILVGAGGASVTGTILAGNISLGGPLNCSVDTGAVLASHGHNIESGSDCGFGSTGDLPLTDPALGGLANNGGETDTMAIGLGSPALDALPVGPDCPSTDQRGFGRPSGPACDVGAYELHQPAPPPAPAAPAQVAPENRPPTAAFSTNPESPKTADPVGFDGSVSTDPDGDAIVSYSWNYGDGSGSAPAATPTASHTYARAGTYTVALTVVDVHGAAATATKTVRVDTNLPPSVEVADSIEQLSNPASFQEANVQPEGAGEVFVKLPGASGARAAQGAPKGFIPLTQAAQLPLGSILDTSAGQVVVESTSNRSGSRTQTARFYSGMFQMKQTRSARPITEMVLKGGSFRGCPRTRSKGSTAASERAAESQRRRRSSRVRRVWGNGKGRFRTRGRYSSATVRGTTWLTEDRCDGTLTRVARRPRTNRVAVRDLRARRTITLRAGQRYLARPVGKRR